MRINLTLLLFAILQSLNALVFLNSSPETFRKLGLPVPQGDMYNLLLGALWFTLGLSYFIGAYNNNFVQGMLLLGVINAVAEVITYGYVCFRTKDRILRIALLMTITVVAALGFICGANLLS